MKAVCGRCGSGRDDYRDVCPACGHRPEGEGLLVAWLLSDEAMPADKLAAAGARIARGEPLRPSERQLDRARKALGAHLEGDPGLTVAQRIGLIALSLLITPLPGVVLWAWWRQERPRAAVQSLALSAPMGLVFAAFLVWQISSR